jgi:integrase
MLKLKPPRAGKSPHWTIRGTHLGTRVNRSAKTGERRLAAKELAKVRDDIESGRYAKAGAPTFASAAVSYMQAGGDRRFLAPLIKHFGTSPLASIGQAEIDAAALALYPRASPATRNRQVYAVASVVIRRAGVALALKRPKGSQGAPRTDFLAPDAAFSLLDAAAAVGADFGALCTFLLYTGARLSEALALRCDDVDLARQSATRILRQNTWETTSRKSVWRFRA